MDLDIDSYLEVRAGGIKPTSQNFNYASDRAFFSLTTSRSF